MKACSNLWFDATDLQQKTEAADPNDLPAIKKMGCIQS
jgi:hypothetical protein